MRKVTTDEDAIFFAERNTGSNLWNFHRPLVHKFTHFIVLVSEHVFNNVASPRMKVANDQIPFNMALYLFSKLHPEFNEQQIPMHVSCRTYANRNTAGIDAARNGTHPRLKNGEFCRDCSCTPCLINHQLIFLVTIDNCTGWDDNNLITGKGNSDYSIVFKDQ